MKFGVKTSDLQEMVSKVSVCVSNNKLIPLTSLMSIGVKDHCLILTTTDATNYFYAIHDKVDCEDFEVSVLADLFTKLIQKTTTDNIVLEIDGGTLKVEGNGCYTMELPLDENGSVIKFPKKFNDPVNLPQVATIKLSTIKALLAVNKASLAQNVEIPALTNYYCGDKVVTSDRYKICSTNIHMFDKPILVSSTLMDLLGVMTDEDITYSESGAGYCLFETDHEIIYSPKNDDASTFPIDAVNQLVDTEMPSKCSVSRVAVLSVLERLSLFVSPYDKHTISLTFANNGLILSNKQSSGSELVPYTSSDNFEPFTAMIDIEMLRSQVNTFSGDELNIEYGSDIAIKLTENNITEIVSLADDEAE